MRSFWTELRRALLELVAAGILALLVAAVLQAQPPPKRTPPGDDSPPARLRLRAEMVGIPVSVADARGNPLRGLAQHNFRVLVGGAEQPVIYFAPLEEPARIFLLVEGSPAVFLIHKQHLLAASEFLDGLAPDDQVALATYDAALRRAMDFTADKQAVYRALNAPRYAVGSAQLNLFAGLAEALDSLAAFPGRKSLVLLSTGLDTSAPGGLPALSEKVRRLDVAIFPVALGGTLRDFAGEKAPDSRRAASRAAAGRSAAGISGSDMSFAQADRDLRSLAAISGGRAFFPRKLEDLPDIYRQLAALLRHQYFLGISPAAPSPAGTQTVHALEVQVLDARGRVLAPRQGKSRYTISARPGYVAPAP